MIGPPPEHWRIWIGLPKRTGSQDAMVRRKERARDQHEIYFQPPEFVPAFIFDRTLDPALNDFGLLMPAEVRVALCAGGQVPVGHRCERSQGPAILEPLHQIGVADERPTEGDQVGVSIGNRLLSRLLRVATVAHQRAVEHLSELGQRHRLAEVVEAERQVRP